MKVSKELAIETKLNQITPIGFDKFELSGPLTPQTDRPLDVIEL